METCSLCLVQLPVQVLKALKLREVNGHRKHKLGVVEPDFVSVAPFNMTQHDNEVAATPHFATYLEVGS